jgi:lipoyl(octanoyl) transferase
LSYCVKYEDIDLRDYKETWDYQAILFKELVDAKKGNETVKFSGPDNLPGTLIFVEHPNVYTLGRSGSENNLLLDYLQLKTKDASFYKIDRGGDITFHGPGQIVGYPIFDLEVIHIGLKEYIFRIEEVIIRSAGEYGITCSRLDGGTGVWVDPGIPGKERKICAIGVKASKFITMHGFAFNVNTDLTYFSYINPCGFKDKGVTSIEKETGHKADIKEVKEIVKNRFREVFDLSWVNKNS